MAVTLYIWSLTENNVGHASMQVGSHYISFWPSGGAKAKKDFTKGTMHEPMYPREYRADKRLERKECDKKVEILNMNESKMIETWEDFKVNSAKYNMVKQNCSTIIAVLLEAGSGLAPTVDKGLNIDDWTTSRAQQIFLKLKFLGNHIEMWTPNDVWRYALKVKSHMGQ